MLSVMGTKGPTSLNIEEVGLVTVSSPEIVSNSRITGMDGGNILVEVDAVPGGEFVILVKGTDEETKSEFQRQSTTQMSVSKVNIKVRELSSDSRIDIIQFNIENCVTVQAL